MTLIKLLCWLGIAFVVATLSTPVASEERRYLELTTREFILISAVSEEQTRQIARRIGMFRAAFEQAFGVTLSTSMPLRIYALGKEDWTRHAQPRPGVAGYFLAHPFSSDLLFDAEDEHAGAYELMLHEYTHYILRTFWTSELPAFFDEGLAEVLSTATFDGETVRLGPRIDYVRYLRRHDWLPFEQLLHVRRSDAEYADHALAPAFYAQSWATLHYALTADPIFGRRIMEYIGELSAGGSRLRAAERLIGEASGRANRNIASFLRRKRIPTAEIRITNALPLAEASVRELNPIESTMRLGELLLRMGTRNDEALALFEMARRQRPGTPRALIGAGWAHLQNGNEPEAAALFDLAANLPRLDRPASLALGRGLFQLAAQASHASQRIDERHRDWFIRARELFESCLEDERIRLEAINGYVLANLALDEHDESLVALAESAHRAAPRSSELAVALAILHELAGRKELARGYWRKAARITHAGPMRARILSELEERAIEAAE